MKTIEKIRIRNVNDLAEKIVSQLPDMEPSIDNIDESGEYYEHKEFDIYTLANEAELILYIWGLIKVEGSYKQVRRQTYEQPAEYDYTQENEIWKIEFYVNGERVEISNEKELINKINKLI